MAGNWQLWDTIFILAGIICIAIALGLWMRTGLLTRIAGLALGGFLVGYGLMTGFSMEAVYPLILLAAPLVVLGLGLWEMRKRAAAGQAARAGAPLASPSGGRAPAAAPAPLGAPRTAPAPAEQRWPEEQWTSEPAAEHANAMRPAFEIDEDELAAERAERERAARAIDPSRGPEQPKATHEEIDAALADWYFEPEQAGEAGADAEGAAQPRGGATAATAGAVAGAATAHGTADDDDDDRLLGGGPAGDLDGGFADGPRTLDEVRDAPPARPVAAREAIAGADDVADAEADADRAASPAVEPAAEPVGAPAAQADPAHAEPAAEPAPAPAPAPAEGHGFTAQLASDPATAPAVLHRIAAEAPELHPQLAANPALYPALREWLASSPDPLVQQALAGRDDA